MLLNKNCIVRERAEIIYLRRAGETLDFIEETNEAAELFASLGVQLARHNTHKEMPPQLLITIF
jgi:hypothetical protein